MMKATPTATEIAIRLFMARPPSPICGRSCPIGRLDATANVVRRSVRWMRRTAGLPGSQTPPRMAFWTPYREGMFVGPIRLFWAAIALAFLCSASAAHAAAPDSSPPPPYVPPAPPPFPNFGSGPSTRHHRTVTTTRHVATSHKAHPAKQHRASVHKNRAKERVHAAKRRHETDRRHATKKHEAVSA